MVNRGGGLGSERLRKFVVFPNYPNTREVKIHDLSGFAQSFGHPDGQIPSYHLLLSATNTTSLLTNGPAIGHFINPGITGITNSVHNVVISIVIAIPSVPGHGDAASGAQDDLPKNRNEFTKLLWIWANLDNRNHIRETA